MPHCGYNSNSKSIQSLLHDWNLRIRFTRCGTIVRNHAEHMKKGEFGVKG